MSNKIRSQTSITSVNVTGKSGKLRTVVTTDSATISINIDNTGAVVFTAKSIGSSNLVNNTNISSTVTPATIDDQFLLGDATNNQYTFNLEFSTSLVLSVSAGTYYIVWDEDIF